MPGRHRQLHRTGIAVAASAAAVVVVASGSFVAYRQFSGKECSSTITLKVSAPSEIAPAITTSAAAWAKTDAAKVGDSCVVVSVAESDSPVMASAIGAQHGVNLLGVGAKSQASADIDVWVPDSSTWLLRLASDAPGFVPTVVGSIAESPLVMAVPTTSAASYGWPSRTQGLNDLVKRIAADKAMRPGIVNPSQDATGLAALLALAGAAGTGASSGALKVGMMRAFSSNSSSIRADLLQKFPSSAGDVSGTINMAPMSEADLISYNGNGPAVQLAALYPAPTPPVLNYPFAVMPGIDPGKAAAATSLHDYLATGTFVAELAKAGLRAPDGTVGPGFPAPQGAPGTVAPPPAAKDPKAVAAAVGQLLGSWQSITQPGRMLAVFDVSGSMEEKVPTAGGLTRADVMRKAASDGFALLDERWQIGNWTFSTDMVGKRPWIENCPIESNATHHAELVACLDTIVPKRDGGTGLYDTALAAYKNVQKGWDPGLSNSVVLYTDGKNDNPGGLELKGLIAQMTAARDTKKPVRMIIIGVGPDVDKDELNTIAKASGNGAVFVATDPAQIGGIILQAIASRKGA